MTPSICAKTKYVKVINYVLFLNAEEGIKTYFDLYNRGVELVFLKEAYINTDTYKNSLKDKIELTGSDEDEIFKGLNNYFRRLAEKQIRIAFEQAQKHYPHYKSGDIRDLRTSAALILSYINIMSFGFLFYNIF